MKPKNCETFIYNQYTVHVGDVFCADVWEDEENGERV